MDPDTVYTEETECQVKSQVSQLVGAKGKPKLTFFSFPCLSLHHIKPGLGKEGGGKETHQNVPGQQ